MASFFFAFRISVAVKPQNYLGQRRIVCLVESEEKKALTRSWKHLAEKERVSDELQADLEFTFHYLKKIETSNKAGCRNVSCVQSGITNMWGIYKKDLFVSKRVVFA